LLCGNLCLYTSLVIGMLFERYPGIRVISILIRSFLLLILENLTVLMPLHFVIVNW